MIYKKESELEAHIRRMFYHYIDLRSGINLLQNKKVADLVICREQPVPSIFFIETKLYTPKKNRIGLGSGAGKGFQPEILLNRPVYFEEHLRWLICQDNGEDQRFIFVPSSTVSRYLANDSIEAKHNNIRREIFRLERLLDLKELFGEIRTWIERT